MLFLLLLVVMLLLGSWGLRPFGVRADLEGLLFRGFTGASLAAVLILALGSFSLTRANYAILLLAAVGWGYELRMHNRPAAPQAPRPAHAPGALMPQSPFDYYCAAVVATVLFCYLLTALTPIADRDAASAQLALARDYQLGDAIRPIEGNAYALFPQLPYVLYAFAYGWKREASLSLLHLTCAVGLCAALFALARRIGGAACAWPAVAILASAPVFIAHAGTLSLDIVFAAYTTTALLALVVWRQERRCAPLAIAGALAGSACGILHAGGLVAAILALAVPILAPGKRLRAGLLFTGAALCFAAPWLLRSYWLTGHLAFPYTLAAHAEGAVSPVDLWPIRATEAVAQTGRAAFALHPWRLVMRPAGFGGMGQSPGPWVLLLGVAGIVWGGAAARSLAAFSVTGGAVLFFFRQGLRAYLPFFVPMMAVGALGAVRSGPLQRPVRGLLAVSFAVGVAHAVVATLPLVPVTLGAQSPEDFLAARVDRYPAIAWANEHLDKPGRLLTMDPRTYYFQRPTYQDYRALKAVVGRPIEEQLAWLRARNIRYLFYTEAYLLETPDYQQSGVASMIEYWRRNYRAFAPIKRFELPRLHGDGAEWVEIYEIKYGDT